MSKYITKWLFASSVTSSELLSSIIESKNGFPRMDKDNIQRIMAENR